MAMEHHPIMTSSVILLNSAHTPANPPPSPPTPASPCERPLTPDLDDLQSITSDCDQTRISTFDQRLSNAVHVLGTEATALSHLTRLYETDPIARGGFNAAVEAITRHTNHRGKVVVSGIGKSGFICQKLAATLKSLHIQANYLHPTEALHGDLGGIDPENDTILLITFSGSTPELLELLRHIPPLPLIVMTRHIHGSTCEIVRRRPDAILLPAPIHVSETDSFGFNAPTTSTTACLALCDALAVVLANYKHSNVASVFARYHPGGAIGAATRSTKRLSDLTTTFSDITEVEGNVTGAHILMSVFRSKTRWMRQGNDLMPPRRIEGIQTEHLNETVSSIPYLRVPRQDWIEFPDSLELFQVRELVTLGRESGDQRFSDGILAAMDDDEVTGVLEIEELMKES